MLKERRNSASVHELEEIEAVARRLSVKTVRQSEGNSDVVLQDSQEDS